MQDDLIPDLFGNRIFSTDAKQDGLGQKYDSGKILAACLFEYFPDALMSVAEVATYGANKYVRNGWRDVPDKETRYADAFFRHILKDYMGEEFDDESGLRHKAHAAWNALALLQMEIENNKDKSID